MAAIRLALPNDPIPQALFSSLGFLITWLADRLTRLYERGLKDFELRPPHHAILITLADLPPIRQARLGERLRVDHATFVNAVNDLERRGMLQREADPADRRTLLVHLTDQGSELLAQVESTMRRIEADEFSALEEHDRTRLIQSLGTVVASVSERATSTHSHPLNTTAGS